MGDHQSVDQLTSFFSCRYMGYILLRYHANPLTCNMRLSLDAFALGEGPTRGDYLTWAFIRYDELCLFEALHPAPLARPFSKGLLARDYLTWAFIPLRRVVPLRGTAILSLWRGPSPRAYARGLSHIGFHAAATNCASSRHCNPLPLARPFFKALVRWEEYPSP